MRQRLIEPTVLNARPPGPSPVPLATLAGELRARLAALIARHADAETGLVDYQSLAASEDFTAYVGTTASLRTATPSGLPTPEARIAFWANLYNALTLHAIVALDIRAGVGEVHEFFLRVCYDVGGDLFALADIEHGVLRGNRTARNLPAPVWTADDRRHRWAVERFDPRLHMALTCGARSCPPIRAWDAAQLDAQLDLAARAFVSAHVELEPAQGVVRLPRIFHWYEEDFGDVLGWVLGYLDAGRARDWLAAHRRRARVEYRAYDWELNARAPATRPA